MQYVSRINLKFSATALLLWLFCLACTKDVTKIGATLPVELPQVRSGYLYISCEHPPYYINIDSLYQLCSENGVLPDTFPQDFRQLFEEPDPACLQYLRKHLDQQQNHTIQLTYTDQTIDIQSPLLNIDFEQMPINIAGSTYQAGQYPYLGGYRVTSDSIQGRFQVVNQYIGGCYHNLVVWELSSP